MTLVPLPALADNYILMLHDGSRAIVADTMGTRPRVDALAKCPPQLAAILVTHHDGDLARWRRQASQASFALAAEPADADRTPYGTRCKASRTPRSPTLPTSPMCAATGRRIHPVLRSRGATVIAAVHRHCGPFALTGEADVALALRQWKNDLR